MKIDRITLHILRVPLGSERFYSSQCAFPERTSLLVRIDTDEGISGWGEAGQYGPCEPTAACIEHVFGPRLIGADPLEIGRIWERQYAAIRDFGRKGPYIEAISGLDIALWDISGKYLGQPIHKLLGGAFRDRITAYATGCYYRGEQAMDVKQSLPSLVEEARSYRQQGFQILKTKIGLLSVQDDLDRMGAIREAVGEKTVLLVDCNHAYTVATAIRVGRELEALRVGWLEEPVVPEDRDGYRRVRRALHIPIAGGECEYTRWGFRELIGDGCVDIAQPDLCVCGGISEFTKIATIADTYGVMVLPHIWGSGIALAAGLQVLAAMPPTPHTANPVPLQNDPVLEYDRNPNPLRDELLSSPFMLEEGGVKVPDGPGLSVEVRQEVLSQYRVRTATVPASGGPR